MNPINAYYLTSALADDIKLKRDCSMTLARLASAEIRAADTQNALRIAELWAGGETLELPTIAREGFALRLFVNLFNGGDCLTLSRLVAGRLETARVIDGSETRVTRHRTSLTSDLSLSDHPIVGAFAYRLKSLLAPTSYAVESLQGQYYRVGDYFKPHCDAFYKPYSEATPSHQRTWTAMVYLNDVRFGGETRFTNVGVDIAPRQGLTLLWNNLEEDGETPHPMSTHEARPVEVGEKMIVTQWFRQRLVGRTQGRLVAFPCVSL